MTQFLLEERGFYLQNYGMLKRKLLNVMLETTCIHTLNFRPKIHQL